jgi:hypothetical protein
LLLRRRRLHKPSNMLRQQDAMKRLKDLETLQPR